MSGAVVSAEIGYRLATLLYECVRCIDDGRLEDWLDFFAPDCAYTITTRENRDGGYPIAILYCRNRDMLHDRVVAIRSENVYKPHYDRHVIGNVVAREAAPGSYALTASYAVYQTDLEGATELFSTGVYEAVVTTTDGRERFAEMVVVIDTFAVPNHLSTPI